MTILGVDLSLSSTGCIYLRDGKVIKQKLIRIKQEKEGHIGELERLLKIRESIDIDDVSLVAIEGLAFMARNSTALVQLSGLNYLLREKLYSLGIPFVIVTPTSLKKFITGKGNVAKEMMLLETYKRFNVSFESNDLCDAFGLAQCGAALMGVNTIELIAPQKEVVKLLLNNFQKR